MRKSRPSRVFMGLSGAMAILFLIVLAFASNPDSNGISFPNGHFGYNLHVWNVGADPVGGNWYNIHSSHSCYLWNRTNKQLVVQWGFRQQIPEAGFLSQTGGYDGEQYWGEDKGGGTRTLEPAGNPGSSVYASEVKVNYVELTPGNLYHFKAITGANDTKGDDATDAWDEVIIDRRGE